MSQAVCLARALLADYDSVCILAWPLWRLPFDADVKLN